jgi:hypothetical protein
MEVLKLILQVASSISSLVGIVKEIIIQIKQIDGHKERTDALKSVKVALKEYRKTGDKNSIEDLYNRFIS